MDFEEEEVLAAGEDMDTEQHTSSSPPDEQQQQPPSPDHHQSSSSTSSSSHHQNKEKSSGTSSSGYKFIDDQKPVTARAIWELFEWNNEWLYQLLEDSNWDRHTEAATSYADLRAHVQELNKAATEAQVTTDNTIKEMKASLEALSSSQNT